MISGKVLSCDLTNINGIDAIVCSVNNQFRHGSGIAKQLSKLAGSDYEKSCQRLLRSRCGISVPLGTAHLMNAGSLALQGVKYVINACAMGYTDNRQRIPATKKTLIAAIEASMNEANTAGCRSILFPLMCAHAGGLAPMESAVWTIAAIRRWVSYNPNSGVDAIHFNSFDFRDPMKSYEREWIEARHLNDCPSPAKAVRYLELLEVARDELLRMEYLNPYTLNGGVIANIDEALYAAGFSRES
jgi:O-acetyl-ADP-ribose deacetylase (regulator of RNase III)